MSAVPILDFYVPGDRAAFCVDCGATFHLARGTCPSCSAETVVPLLNFLNAISRSQEAKCNPSHASKASSSRS